MSDLARTQIVGFLMHTLIFFPQNEEESPTKAKSKSKAQTSPERPHRDRKKKKFFDSDVSFYRF